MCRVSLDLKNYEIKNAKNQISEYLDDSNFEAYVNELDIKNIYIYVYDLSEYSQHDIIFTTLITMIIDDTGEQFFIDNAKLANVDGLFQYLIFEDDLVFRRDKLTEVDFKGAMFEGNVIFDCDCFTSAFTFCTFCGDMIFTNNCKWCGAFKSIVSQGKIIIPGGMLSIDISNFIMLFKGSTTYTGTKDEFLALVARSDIPEHWVDRAKEIVKFTKIDWEK